MFRRRFQRKDVYEFEVPFFSIPRVAQLKVSRSLIVEIEGLKAYCLGNTLVCRRETAFNFQCTSHAQYYRTEKGNCHCLMTRKKG